MYCDTSQQLIQFQFKPFCALKIINSTVTSTISHSLTTLLCFFAKWTSSILYCNCFLNWEKGQGLLRYYQNNFSGTSYELKVDFWRLGSASREMWSQNWKRRIFITAIHTERFQFLLLSAKDFKKSCAVAWFELP